MIEDTDRGDNSQQQLALNCIAAGIRAAEPSTVVAERVSLDGRDLLIDDDRYDLTAYKDIIVLGGGNAAATVAQVFTDMVGKWIDGGVVVTDNPVEMDFIEVLPGDHPVPSKRGVENTRTLMNVADSAGPGDLVVVVITGGGSALLPAPTAGIGLADLQTMTERLLACGASIDEINAVRKHCSDLKGGQLARTISPATTLGLVISDVVGNRLDIIASGPLTPDDSSYADAMEIIERYAIDVPDTVATRLRQGNAGEYAETPNSNETFFDTVRQYIIADGNTSLRGAAERAQKAGYEPLLLSSRIQGEAQEAAKVLTGIAEECADTGSPVEPPAALLSSGETTVTIQGDGTGGPNQEFALSAALELTDSDIAVASVDTDGIDGNSEAAGGIVSGETAEPRLEAQEAVEANNAEPFLKRRNGLIITGPTRTNINDLRVFIVPGE